MNKKIDIFLDSGAFTAWKRKREIDIQSYIGFIKENSNYFSVYANLDVISENHKSPNETTAIKTLKNQKIIEKAGLNPIPVFHKGEPVQFLDDYIAKYDYIGLGMGKDIGNSSKLIPWLNECFAKICDEKGRAKVKVHGFAVTNTAVMLRYPWYSVDSFTPNISAAWGGIFLPKFRKGIPDFSDTFICTVSEQGHHTSGSANWATMPKSYQKQCVDMIESHGFTFGTVFYQKRTPRRGKNEDSLPKNQLFNIIQEDPNKTTIAGDWVERMRWNLVAWHEMKKLMPVHKFTLRTGKSFKQRTKLYIGASSKVMLKAVSEHRWFDILVSYAYFNKESEKFEMLKLLNK